MDARAAAVKAIGEVIQPRSLAIVLACARCSFRSSFLGRPKRRALPASSPFTYPTPLW